MRDFKALVSFLAVSSTKIDLRCGDEFTLKSRVSTHHHCGGRVVLMR